MAAIVQVTKTGPRTYTPVEPILGGQLVEGRPAGAITGQGGSGAPIGVAAAGSLKVVGVALTDAQAPGAVVTTPTIVGGRSVLNAAILPASVAVAYGGIEVPVTYAAAATFGDLLIAAANGQVTPAGVTPDARTIVGRCTAPAGAAAGAVGLMRTA